MVRNYVRKSNRRSWTVEQLRSALEAVKNGVSKNNAAREYAIPKKTLLRYLTKPSSLSSLPSLGSFTSVFTKEQERQLVNYIVEMSERYYGLTTRDIRSLAFELAEMNQISHPFSQSEKLAGYDWLKGFLKRYPNLSLRSAENTSLARATGFNRSSVRKYFDVLTEIFTEQHYPPHRIWNMDETGFSTVQNKPSKVLARRGQHQVGGISSSERGINTTVVMAMSASGEYLPPMFIFARQRMNDALKTGAPEGSVFACNPSGWSSLTTCSDWFDHFISYTRPSVQSPVLLILDGHSTHTRNLQMLEKAKKNYVRIVSIPPHTSHKIQPLDVALMGPLKSHYATAVGNFLKRNPGKAITSYNICALVNYAFVKSANMLTAQNGFRATGIHPFDPLIFAASDFVAAEFLLGTSTRDNVEHPEQSSNSPGEIHTANESNANVSTMGTLSDTITIDQIDANEYYVILSNGDIIIGSASNPSSILTNPNEEDHDKKHSLCAADINGDITLEQTPKHSLFIGTQRDEVAPTNGGALLSANLSIEEKENVVPVQIDTVKMVAKKKRNRIDALHLLPRSDADVNNNQTKKGRWDRNINHSMPRQDNFAISPRSVAKKMEKRVESRRKKVGWKKESAAELTSSSYRKKLIETTALKDIKNIKKTTRKRTAGKTNIIVTDAMDDVLCFICGITFSVSANGKGWSKCLRCQKWFHATCFTNFENCDACY